MATKKKTSNIGTSSKLSIKGAVSLPSIGLPKKTPSLLDKVKGSLGAAAATAFAPSQKDKIREALGGVNKDTLLFTPNPNFTPTPEESRRLNVENAARSGTSAPNLVPNIGQSSALSVNPIGPRVLGRSQSGVNTPAFDTTNVAVPNALTSEGLGARSFGASSTSSATGPMNLPSAPTGTGYSGVLPSIQASTQPGLPGGSIDPLTGQPVVADGQQEQDDSFRSFLKESERAFRNRPSQADLYAQAEQESGVMQQRQLVNDYSAQLNAITAKAEADKLSLIGQGRGIPEVIIGGQQAAIEREAAIRALPVAAQLAAAQGNLELAQDHLDMRFKLLSEDAENEYNYKKELYGAVYNYAKEKDKRRLELLDKQEDRAYAERKEYLDIQNKMLISATSQNAPRSVINAINSARNPREAIIAAGAYGSDILDRQYKIAQINSLGMSAFKAEAEAEDRKQGYLTEQDIKRIESSPEGKKLSAASDLKLKLSSYQDLVEKYGFELTGAEKAVLQNAYTELQLKYKEAANLGALTGPDLGLVETAIRSATPGFWGNVGNVLSLGQGTRNLTANLEQAQATLNQAASQTYEQLLARDPLYETSLYVKSLVLPFGEELLTSGDKANMDAIINQ